MRIKTNTEFGRAICCAESQEEAAHQLGVGLRSLQKYLYGEAYPPCSVIAAAAREYGAHRFALKHLTTACPVATMYLPTIELRDLPTSVLMLQKELGDMQIVQSEMVEIACDGSINDTEHRRWQSRISPEIRDAIRVLICTDVVVKQKPPALTSRRFLG